MWKFSRTLAFPRWYASSPKSFENKNRNVICTQAIVPTLSFGKKEHSDQSNRHKEEHFNKQNKRFWNCSHFQFLLSKSCLLETAGWLGTVTVLCFNFHHKQFYSLFKSENVQGHCIFSSNVFAMAQDSIVKNEEPQCKSVQESHSSTSIPEESKHPTVETKADFMEDLKKGTPQYLAAIQNSAGLACLENNNKKAFRCFQSAARLGSTQGFYNLGLCYELGKGTRVNLTRAAFCYKKAAMKGHGLAAFNLAIYFLKGLGGLPVEPETAQLLMTEAAAKNIPEAQMYIGLKCLEEEKWSDAHEIFDKLAKSNVPDGKYYLGLCYENGWGTSKDVKRAIDLYSQSAALGHSKSILSLSRCYEEGIGGDTDLDFALSLSQILVDQGDEEGRKVFLRQKLRKEYMGIKDLFKLKLPSLSVVKTGMHTSSSVPEFTTDTKPITRFHPASIISSYLDLITYSSTEAKKVKPAFYVGDNDLNLSLTHSYTPCVQS